MLRLVVVLTLLFIVPSAASDSVFSIPEVPVFAEAPTSAQAREKARDQGRALAFDLLLRRLVAEEDWTYLPRASEGQPAMIEPIPYSTSGVDPQPFAKKPIAVDPAMLRRFEQETNVFNEKSSGSTYRARITYRFKPDAVRQLLQDARLPYSEEQAREAMVLPVLRTADEVYLWEAKNPWARAWLERPLTQELTPFVLPRGDIVDVEAITADEAMSLNAARLRSFAERYEVERLLLAVARLTEKDDEFRLSVRLVDATPPSNVGGTSAIGSTVTETFFRGQDDDFPALARRAVEGTVQRHARQWKQRTLVDYSRRRTFQLTAWFDEQREWSDIQQAIASSALVVDSQDGPFNNENAIFKLTVVGEDNQFRLAMAQFNLDVWQDTGGRWHIAEKMRAARLKQNLRPLTTDIDQQLESRRGLGRLFGRRNDQRGGGADDVPDLPQDLFGNDPSRN